MRKQGNLPNLTHNESASRQWDKILMSGKSYWVLSSGCVIRVKTRAGKGQEFCRLIYNYVASGTLLDLPTWKLEQFTKLASTLCNNLGLPHKPVGNCRPFRVRRLSTVSSVVAAAGHVFSTRWLWYWQDGNKWQSYDTPADGHAVNTTSSLCLEREYMAGRNQRSLSPCN